ncbi:nucleotide pyrophosphohydrolase [Legionella sp. MW5194]|uniref:MazG nucleotide pyrophosphohydrolase domain-containing protein n=1 Tax=Legionella sp. MW5194 TaxID=2662448 RepID=UPI00193E4783|nr:MazG nucleotide pyrophosphohydrolase domain-containing protein [Legionella sp. MW5194]QRN04973.1 nucleotide pyrophosphohydrolase [Legionella sp. MW5194]
MTETALQRLLTLEKEVRDFGFLWPDADMIIEQAISECQEIKEALDNRQSAARVQEEVGDLLHTALSLCCFLNFNVHETLARTADKFTARMEALKALAGEKGYTDLKGQPIEFLGELWQEVKRRTSEP